MNPTEDNNQLLTVDDMEEEFGLVLNKDIKRIISSGLSYLARQRGDVTTTARKRYQVASGKHQSYMVVEYPANYIDSFEQLCVALGCWEDPV